MEYNTQREDLPIAEHGRNVKKMVNYAMSVENREERTKLAHNIVDVMTRLNPQLKEFADYKHKLWDHLFYISDFKLDVDAPFPMPEPKEFEERPDRVPYPSNHIVYKHYGKNTQRVIEEIKNLPDGEDRSALVSSLANFMKMLYLNWNRDSVSDELILEQLDELSGGDLKLSEGFTFKQTSQIISQTRQKPQQQQHGRSGGNNKNRNNNNKNNNNGGKMQQKRRR